MRHIKHTRRPAGDSALTSRVCGGVHTQHCGLVELLLLLLLLLWHMAGMLHLQGRLERLVVLVGCAQRLHQAESCQRMLLHMLAAVLPVGPELCDNQSPTRVIQQQAQAGTS